MDIRAQLRITKFSPTRGTSGILH